MASRGSTVSLGLGRLRPLGYLARLAHGICLMRRVIVVGRLRLLLSRAVGHVLLLRARRLLSMRTSEAVFGRLSPAGRFQPVPVTATG